MPFNCKSVLPICILPLLFLFQTAVFASEGYIRPDTTKAHKAYAEAIVNLDEDKYDIAAELFQDAARLFRKKHIWERAIECSLLITKARSLNADEVGLIEFCSETLEFSKQKMGRNHPLTGDCYNRLEELYYQQHLNVPARQCFDNAIKIYSTNPGSGSLAIAKVFSNLGELKMNLSEFDSAEVFLQMALDIQLDLLDTLDPNLLPTYNTFGALHYYLGNHDKAIASFEKTLEIRVNKFGENHSEVAKSYNNLGSAYEKKKEFQKAVNFHKKALNIRQAVLDSLHPHIALSYNNLANAWFGLGEYKKSNEYHYEALRLRLKIHGDSHLDLAMSYTNLGNNMLFQDDPNKALYYFRKVIPIVTSIYGPDHLLTSDAYEHVGLPFYYTGVPDSAFHYLFKALKIRENIQNGINMSVARSYNNIGSLYKENRDYQLALSYYNNSAEIYRIFLGENCYPLAGTYNNIGEVYLETGEYEKSHEYFQKALELNIKNLGPENPKLASRYLNLGAVAAEMGQYHESLAYNRKALQYHVDAYGENNRLASSLYGNMAMDYMEMDSLEKALEYMNHAVSILIGVYGEDHFDLSSHYTNLGKLMANLGNEEDAYLNLLKGLSVNYYGKIDPANLANTDIEMIKEKNRFVESLVALKELNRSHFSSIDSNELLRKNLPIYELIADITVKLRGTYRLEKSKLYALKEWDYLYTEAFETAAGLYELTDEETYFNKAFRFAGLKKTSALTDAILISQAMENSRIPDTIIHIEKSLNSKLEGLRQNLSENDSTIEDIGETKTIENEINSTIIKLNELYLSMEEEYPEYNKLRSHYPDYMPEDIIVLLDQKTLLLDFVVSEYAVYTIVISKEGRWLEKTKVPADFISRVNDLLRSVKKYRTSEFVSSSKEIYGFLLQDLEKHFEGIDKIITIPESYLLLLPFDILINNKEDENKTDLKSHDYLINRFEIVSHYSTDLWVRSRLKSPAAGANDLSISGFLGFAPIFDAHRKDPLNVMIGQDTLYTDRAVVDRMSLQELPFSGQEIENIVSLFSASGNKARGMLRSEATEENFRETAKNYKYVHIATHGLINPDKPELSGLVFWKDTSDNSSDLPQLFIADKKNDGVLYTREIYNLDLSADLVTLSACETGAGKLVKGEGLLSFVRGFSFSGVPNMLISYWKVNDKTTAEFMLDFYEGVLSGESYSAALRKAKLAAISNPSTSFPSSWGNFVLIGN